MPSLASAAPPSAVVLPAVPRVLWMAAALVPAAVAVLFVVKYGSRVAAGPEGVAALVAVQAAVAALVVWAAARLPGGMPHYRYVANRAFTLVQNVLVWQKLSEHSTGFRAFSRPDLEAVDYHANSDDFVFDNQMLSQIIAAGFETGEVTCPTRYFAKASSIDFRRSVTCGLGVLGVSARHLLHRTGRRRARALAPRRR